MLQKGVCVLRVTKSAPQRRQELVTASRALFDEKGVAATRVSDIVRRVGVAQGVFYYYFPSKAHMVDTVLQQVSGEVRQKATAILGDDQMDFYGKLAGFIEMILDLVDQFLGDDETCLPPAEAENEGRGSLAMQCIDQVMDSLRQLVLQGKRDGLITADYPWETTRVLLFGFRRLAEEKLPERQMVYTITEESLGLARGSLVAYIPPKP